MFNKNNLIQNWLPPISNDQELLKIKVNFFKNFENKTLKYMTLEYHDFITIFEKSVKENQSINILGLDSFVQKDVIVGCHHFIDELIMTYGLNNLQLFEGGYNYYKRLNPNIKYVTLDTLEPDRPLLLEYPFPRYLDEHPNYKEIIEKCNKLNINVYLDCAWLLSSFNLNLDLTQPCIKGMAMSLSKCFGLHWSRIGVRWLKDKTEDGIFLQNKNRMISYSNLMIGKYYLDRIPMNFLITKYQSMYYQICEDLSLHPGNVILGAHSLDLTQRYGFRDLFLKKINNAGRGQHGRERSLFNND